MSVLQPACVFGIGASELVIIGVVLLIAVGPSRLPKLLKAVVGSYREFRRATRELRASTGIDELLQDEDLRELRKPLDISSITKPLHAVASKPGGERKRALSFTERVQEIPPEGVDLSEIRDEETRPSKEERDSIRAAKTAQLKKEQGIKQAKIAAAQGETAAQAEERPDDDGDDGDDDDGDGEEAPVSAADQSIIDAKLAAAEQEERAERESPTGAER